MPCKRRSVEHLTTAGAFESSTHSNKFIPWANGNGRKTGYRAELVLDPTWHGLWTVTDLRPVVETMPFDRQARLRQFA